MTSTPPRTPRDVHGLITAPGGSFEVIEEDVLGHRMRVFKNRERSLVAYLERSREYGERECLVNEEERLSFAEHADAVASLARALRDTWGIGKGDRVAIFAANSHQWIITFWATVSLGGVVVALNALWSRREAAYGIEHCRPALVVCDARRRHLLPADLPAPVLAMETDIPRLSREFPGSEFESPDLVEDDVAVMLYTSGTSGFPKLVMHSHRNVITAVDFMRFNDETVRVLGAPQAAARRFLLITPLFHISGLHNLVVPRLALGDTTYVYTGRFDIDRILAIVERERITNWIGSPTTLQRLAQCTTIGNYDLSSLTMIAAGSAAVPPALADRVIEALPVLRHSLATTYGQTECSTAATFALPSEREAFPDSVGLPTANMDVEIRDLDGRRVPDGTDGEIWLRGPHVMLGYWDNDEANRRAFAGDRWLRTGDFGRIEHGLLRMTTRRTDLILRGGENVLPMEVEAVLAEHPDIVECGVVGTPHSDLGQEVAAVIVHAPGQPLTVVELRAFLSQRLAAYKIPTRWRITTEPLPRNASEKVQRNLLFSEASR